jgi:hypothetical protein
MKYYHYPVKGLRAIERNLNREIGKIKGRTKAGVWEAALVIRSRAQQLTPVDTTHLKTFVTTPRPSDTPMGPVTAITFHANYALHVHEIQATHRVGQWKFLETAIRELKGKALDIIKRTAQIK